MKKVILFALAMTLSFTTLFAQDAPKLGWSRQSSLGLSLDQLFLLNPKVGGGQSRLGFGGITGFVANKKMENSAWDNSGSLSLGVVRIGSGIFAANALGQGKTQPFQKAIDEIRLATKYGHSFKPGSKWFYAIDGSFMTQLLPTYTGNFLSNVLSEGKLLSKLFSPAIFTAAIGIDYKPTDKLSIFYSPAGYKANIVLDDVIAATKAFTPEGENVFHQVGSLLRIQYANKYFEKLGYKTNLALFSNYLREPQNIDVDWTNELNYELFKGFYLALITNAFYDHDIQVQVSDKKAIGGVNGVGRRLSFTENFIVKYNVNF